MPNFAILLVDIHLAMFDKLQVFHRSLGRADKNMEGALVEAAKNPFSIPC